MKFVNITTGRPPYASPYQLARMASEEREKYAPVVESPAPWYDVATSRFEEGLPVERHGVWHQVWDVIGLTQEECAAREAERCDELREEALRRLRATDWRFTGDRMVRHPPSQEWMDARDNWREVVRGNTAEIVPEPS